MKIVNFIFKNLSFVIIIILVGIIFLQRACAPDPEQPIHDINKVTIDKKEYELLKHKKDTFWRTEHIYYKGDPIPGKTIYTEVPQDIDTAEIIKDYFAKRPYSETVQIETDSINYGTVTVTDTVHQNKLFSRFYDFNLKIPEVHDVIVVRELPKNQLYIGGGLNFDKINLINSVYGGLLLKTKKDHIYGLNLGLSTQFGESITPFIGGSMYWKIRWKKSTSQYGTLNKKAAQLILNNM